MKYNRAFLIRNKKSLPLLEEEARFDTTEDDSYKYWLLESSESFHGEHDNEYFYFKDSRISNKFRLPLDCVELEFTEEEL